MNNEIVTKYFSTTCMDPELPRIMNEIVRMTDFVAEREVQRRFIYDSAKTWRVRIRGMYQGKPAIIQIDSLKLETDEESIRTQFRAQAEGSRVRPPACYLHEPFDEARGFGFSIEEDVTDLPALFDPASAPERAVASFIPFFRELRRAIKAPFWPVQDGDAYAFSKIQADKWLSLAERKNPDHTNSILPIVTRVREAMLSRITPRPLQFMHAHLSGADVRVAPGGKWVVFANHFWGWRQPGHDLAFPLWGQWMSLPPAQRTAESVRGITDVWMNAVHSELPDLVSESDLAPMLLNRLYGSLLLDIPSKMEREEADAARALETACMSEAERLLG